MAKIEIDSSLRLVLLPNEVKRINDALVGKPDYWARIVVDREDADCNIDTLEVYIQGPDGEEEQIISRKNTGIWK